MRSMIFGKTVHNQVLSSKGRDNFDKIDWKDCNKSVKNTEKEVVSKENNYINE